MLRAGIRVRFRFRLGLRLGLAGAQHCIATYSLGGKTALKPHFTGQNRPFLI